MRRLSRIFMGAVCSVVVMAASIYSATVTISNTVAGKTPQYVGFNPNGSSYGFPDGSQWRTPDIYGTPAWWFRQGSINFMRGWGLTIWDEGVIDADNNSNDTDPATVDMVTDEASYNAAKAAVIANPETNKYINWDRFDRVKVVRMRELNNMGIKTSAVLRFRHGGVQPSYIGVTADDASLSRWSDKWEWWEYCFAMSYLYSKIADVVHFEIGNEPEYGSQGGMTVTEQMTAIQYGHDAVRQAVIKATGQDKAVIMGSGTNLDSYLDAFASQAGSYLDAISFHTYAQPEDAQVNSIISKSNLANWDLFDTEWGSDASNVTTSGYHSVREIYEVFRFAQTRLKGFLLFKESAGGDNAIFRRSFIENETVPNAPGYIGLLEPTSAFYGYRLLFRAGVNAKDVYTATSTDADVTALVTRDASRTFVTLHNKSTTTKSYTVSKPAWVTSGKTAVYMYDSSTHDVVWAGVTEVAGEIVVTNQPPKSFVQVLYGTALENPPESFSEARYPLKHLMNVYLDSTVGGNLMTPYSDNFNVTPGIVDISHIDTTRWILKSTAGSHVTKGGGRAFLYKNRFYFNNQDIDPTVGPVTVAWHAKQVRLGSTGARLSGTFGFDATNANNDPKLLLLYRDNNGNVIQINTSGNRSQGEPRVYAIVNPVSPEVGLSGTGTLLRNFDFGGEAAFSATRKIVFTITPTKWSFAYYTENDSLICRADSLIHGLILSGKGRFGVGKVGGNPLWMDNVTISDDHSGNASIGFSKSANAAMFSDAMFVSNLDIEKEIVINYTLSASKNIHLALYSLQGELVRTLVRSQVAAGSHRVSISHRSLSPGLYFAELKQAHGTRMCRTINIVK